MEKDWAIRNTPVIGQSFSKFMDYNVLVDKDVNKSYPKSCDYLLDPNSLLAVKTLKSVNQCTEGNITRSSTSFLTVITLGTTS